MQQIIFSKILRRAFLPCLAVIMTTHAFGTTWTNAADGLWRDGINWDGGNPPALSGVYVINGGTKTVTIDALTPPKSLVINSLNIWAPANTTNTLRLSDVGVNNPLVVSNSTLDVKMRGALQITNSSLVVTSVFAGTSIAFNIWAGSVTLDSGSIVVRESAASPSLSTVTRVGRTNIATLNINGGSMLSSTMQVGQAGLPNARSHGTVRMTGGLLTVPGELSIGKSASCTGIVDMVGGLLVVPNNLTNITRIGDQGSGLMIVSNATVSLGNVSVGRHDNADGTLVLLQDGFVGTSDDFSIGRFGNSTGMVFVAGGQLIVTNHPIWVGREGTGKLVVSNGLVSASEVRVATEFTNTASGSVVIAGGTAIVSAQFTVGSTNFSTGQVAVAGGSLMVSNADQTASLAISGGALTLDAGSIAADRLLLTNDGGAMIFNGGTLFSSGTTASNGVPFVVGDGTTAATMKLRGGTHVFADGLVISPNATLTGCGTIIGTVVNNGVNSINCGGPGSPPFILQHPASRTAAPGTAVAFTVAAASTSPLVYQWLLNSNAIPGATASTFTIASAQPAHAGDYNVVVSNPAGSVTSQVALLTVLTAVSITTQPTSQSVTQGVTATLRVVVSGSTPLSYQWRFAPPGLDETNIPGATSATLTLNSPQTNNAGSYRVVASNPASAATSHVARIRVLVPPQLLNITAAGGTAGISFQSLSGLNYVLEYKNHLADAAWTSLTPVPGNGGTLTLTDTSAGVPTRFYRVRTE